MNGYIPVIIGGAFDPDWTGYEEKDNRKSMDEVMSAMISDKKKIVCLILFIVYISAVLKLTIFRFEVNYGEPQINLTLFSDLIKVYKNVGLKEFLRLFLGNIGWFIPFGFLMPMLLRNKSVLKVAVLGFVFSFVIEILQFVFRKGVAELDDLILNTLGAFIGYVLYMLLSKYFFRGCS